MKLVSLIIPVYENEESLSLLYDRLLAVDAKLTTEYGVKLEVIFVNDGSTDASWSVVKNFAIEKKLSVRAVNLSRNFGSMAAIKAGISNVTALSDAFTILSADLQDPPELILQMVREWIEGNKFIISCRKTRNDPISSKIFSSFFYFLVRFLIDKHYPRKGFDIFFLDKCYLSVMKGMGLHLNIPFFVIWLKRNHVCKYIHYDRQEREQGKSKWTLVKKMKLMVDSFLAFSAKPMRLISIFGFSVSFFSFTYSIFLVIYRLTNSEIVPGYTSIMAVLCLLLGLIILMLGIIGEYLSRMYDGVTNKPDFVIEELVE